MVQRLWGLLGVARQRIVNDMRGGDPPSYLCATCFVVGYSLSNAAIRQGQPT